MVDVFGNEIIGAYTNGVTVQAIYANGVLVWPVELSYYYVSWDRGTSYSGTFSMEGNTYNYSDYYPSNCFSRFSGVITSSAFWGGPFSYVETNAIKIEKEAFRSCYSLSQVSLPMCSYISFQAFYGCSSLSQVSLPVCENVGVDVFFACTSLSQVSLPMCKYVSRAAFQSCTALTQVSLPVCSYLGGLAFIDCTSLSQVSLPVCSYVDNGAFQSCSSLSQIYLPVCEYVGEWAFYHNALTQVSLPVCSFIGSYAFAFCRSLSQVNLPVCSYIGGNTFSHCSSFSRITLGYSGVCSLLSSAAFVSTKITSTTGSILVPASLVNAYKVASGWSYFKNRIFSIPT